jgi:hypothetical protein
MLTKLIFSTIKFVAQVSAWVIVFRFVDLIATPFIVRIVRILKYTPA